MGHDEDDEAGTANDEEILAWLREKAETDRVVPGRRAVVAEFGCGSRRADRLRGQVEVPRRMRRVQ